GVIYRSSNASFGSYNHVTGKWYIGDLANGQSVFLDIVVTLNSTGNVVNIANVTVDQNNTGNNSSTPGNNTNLTVAQTVNISIVKTSNVSGNVLNGIDVKYTINVTNHGPDNATGVEITDNLPNGVVYKSSNATVNSYNSANGKWYIGNLANGQSVFLDIVVTLNGTGSVVNIANVTVDQNNTGNNSSTPGNNTNFTVTPTVNISIIKTSNVSGSVLNGIDVRYTINVTNHGPDGATGVEVTDNLPVGVVYKSSNATVGSYDAVTGKWYIGNLANGQSVFLDIAVTLNGTGSVVNIANVTVDQNNTGNNSSTPGNNTNFTVTPTVNITIVKTSNVSGSVLNGIDVKYSINVTNHGPDGATGVEITDNLPVGVVYKSSNATVGSYDLVTGKWYIGNLSNGQSVFLDIVVTLNSTGNVVNVANLTGVDQNNTGNNSSVPGNNTNLSVTPTVNISIIKTSNVSGSVLNGIDVKYSINVTNFGPDGATGVEITDNLPVGVVYKSSNATVNSYNSANGKWYIGNLANGQSVFLDIVVTLNTTGNVVNIASVTVDQNNTSNNSSTPGNNTNFTVTPTVNISIVKTSNVSGSVLNGIDVRYTINVTNFGPDGATGVEVTDNLPVGVVYKSSNATVGYYDLATGKWYIGNLANGQSVFLDIVVTLNSTGNVVNVANLTGVDQNNTGNNSSVPGNNTNLSVTPTVNISIVKTSNVSGSVLNGIDIRYTINVTNHGPDGATGVEVTDNLPVGVIYRSSNATVGSYDVIIGKWYIGNLANGQSVFLDIVVTLNSTGSVVNVASVTVDQNNTGNNSSVPDNNTNLSVTPTVNISVVKSSNVSGNVVNGAYILYTINVTNFGPDGATGLIITDRLDSRLIYINSSSPRSTYYVPGTGVWNIGALANGESIVLDILVRLNGTGNIVNVANVSSVDQNNTGNNSSTPGNNTNITVVTAVNISIVKKSNVSGNVVNGAYILYTINVTNFGPDGATGLIITDRLDSRLIYINSSSPRSTYYVPGTGVWNIGALANGESIVLDILVRLNGTGNIVNVA
ncbi:beta strand repeat-containing protein, partial [Methanobrevibacter curvatus]|uniref:beta strand repeat-containing protein n=1 Tax=Methanobrevibacter curvatus TaxID=49547 RepID=UPI0012ECD1CA